LRKRISITVFLARCFHWLLLVAFLNTVIDAPGNRFLVSFNEMESIYEWVAEDVLDIENAVPEWPDTDNDEQAQKKSVDWISSYPVLVFKPISNFRPLIFSEKAVIYFNPVFDIHTPPPELNA
jgi:hypothetical protein